MKRCKKILWTILILVACGVVGCATYPRAKIVGASSEPCNEVSNEEYIKKKLNFLMYFVNEESGDAHEIVSNVDFLISAACLKRFGMIVSEKDVLLAEKYIWELGMDIKPSEPWTPLTESFDGLEKPHEKFFDLPPIFTEICKE